MASRSTDVLGARGWALAAKRSQFGAGARGLAVTRPRIHDNAESTKRRRIFSAISAISAVSALLVGITVSAQSDRARTEALARRATERLQALQHEADRLAAEERSLLNDVKKLEGERQLRAEELKRVEADAARVQADLDATGARMAALEATSRAETPE